MSSPANSGQRRRPRRNRPRPPSQVVTHLNTLIDLERTQAHGTIPAVRDVSSMRLARDKIYTYSRNFALGVVSAPSGGTDVLGAYNFTLAGLPSPGDFTSLYDEYRFVQIAVSFIPLAGVGTGSPPLVTCIDIDDSTAPVAVSDLYQYESVQFTQPGSVLTRTFTPRCALASYSGVFTSFSLANSRTWNDVASPSIQYYGLKYGITSGSGATANWTVYAKVILQCRHPR